MVDLASLSLLDRFPSSPAGHLGFVENLCDEIGLAAQAKRQQLELRYGNATIESMRARSKHSVRGGDPTARDVGVSADREFEAIDGYLHTGFDDSHG